MTATVELHIEGAVATIALSNPDKRNATSLAMYAAIPGAVERIRAARARCVIVRGAGDRAFGAGSDIAEFHELRRGARARDYNRVEHDATRALAALPMPVLALIHGPCVGGGLGLALCADLRYAADDATFGVPPARLGLGYPIDAAARLVSAIGAARARELLLTAVRVDAAAAAAICLVHAVVPKGELDAFVAARAGEIAELAPLTLAAAKATLHALESLAPEQALDAARTLVDACYASSDYDEGIAAFGEKRAPRFTGE